MNGTVLKAFYKEFREEFQLSAKYCECSLVDGIHIMLAMYAREFRGVSSHPPELGKVISYLGLKNKMARGDHLFVEGRVRGIPFQHHGIDVGDGTVIHLAPADGARVTLRDATERFAVRQVTLEQFAEGREVKVRSHADARDAESIVAAAEAMIGKNGYSLLEGNCEHFATLCATGAWSSHQIEMSHATLTSVASMATKATWVLTAKLSVQAAVRTVAKIHPAALLADGIELIALSLSCRKGLSAERAKQVARVSGNVAAVGIGVVVGGPAGAVVGLATHESSRAIADKLCVGIRKLLG